MFSALVKVFLLVKRRCLGWFCFLSNKVKWRIFFFELSRSYPLLAYGKYNFLREFFFALVMLSVFDFLCLVEFGPLGGPPTFGVCETLGPDQIKKTTEFLTVFSNEDITLDSIQIFYNIDSEPVAPKKIFLPRVIFFVFSATFLIVLTHRF